MTKEELEIKIAKSENLISQYQNFVAILTKKLEDVENDIPVSFRPEAPVTENSPKAEKISYLQTAIKNNNTAIELEQQNITVYQDILNTL